MYTPPAPPPFPPLAHPLPSACKEEGDVWISMTYNALQFNPVSSYSITTWSNMQFWEYRKWSPKIDCLEVLILPTCNNKKHVENSEENMYLYIRLGAESVN